MIQWVKSGIEICMIILGFGTFFAFLRAIKGPRFTDRIVAMNMIGTMVTAIICLLSVYLEQAMLIDVALVYGLLSFLAVVMICHVVTLHHRGRELYLKQQKEEKK